MRDSDYAPKKRSLFPLITTILIIHFVFAFSTFFLMYFFSIFLAPSTSQTIASVLSIILFIAMMYSESWRAGQQDRNLMNFGHVDFDKLRGLKASLYSQIPGILFAILAIIHRLTGALPFLVLSIFKLFYAPFVDLVWVMDQVSPLLYIIMPIFTPVIVHVGYSLGFNGTMLSEKLIYTNKKSTKPGTTRERKFK